VTPAENQLYPNRIKIIDNWGLSSGFMFQFGTSTWGDIRRANPYDFTEQEE
jgi:hypothetical protein